MTDLDRDLERFKRADIRTASFPPFSKSGPPEPPGGPSKRNIPKDHPFDARALKPMSQALWAASVALGHALTAYRQISRLKSAAVSPDGMLGGRGYVLDIKEARKKLYDACEALSLISDTLYDEIQAPHWKPRLAQLDEDDAEDVSRFVEESQEILEDPEADAEKEMKAIEDDEGGEKKTKEPPPEKEQSSEMPMAGPSEEAGPPKPQEKESALRGRPFLAAVFDGGGLSLDDTQTAVDTVVDKATGLVFSRKASEEIPVDPPQPSNKPATMAERVVARLKAANSSLPVDTLPGGPRVDHLRPEGGDGPAGSYNEDERIEDLDSAPWDEYDYVSEWENDLREAESMTPSDPDTKTEGWDFGLGYGAEGQGAGGYENPTEEGRGVWGPHSGLPGAPGGSSGDTTPMVDVSLNERNALLSTLPGDTAPPVARSDYYDGAKNNLVQGESGLPEEASPWESEDIPVDIDTGYISEDVQTPYVRYDFTTPSYRDDPLHNWPQEG